jgi:hypothetical protein
VNHYLQPEDARVVAVRKMTGYFAWLAWTLGEGAFKPFGVKNRAVRPAVPALIPPSWWVKRAAFVNKRKKGSK